VTDTMSLFYALLTVVANVAVHSRFAGELPVDQFASTVTTLSHTAASETAPVLEVRTAARARIPKVAQLLKGW